jgi:hypothetical protein
MQDTAYKIILDVNTSETISLIYSLLLEFCDILLVAVKSKP